MLYAIWGFVLLCLALRLIICYYLHMTTTEKTPKTPSLIERMFEAGAHFGYSRTRRHPSAAPVLYGAKGGTDIIDLEKTCSHLATALGAVKEYAAKGKTILFVGTKPEARAAVAETATALNVPYVTERWIGGTLTNFSEIRKRVERLKTLQTQKERGELSVYSKKERRDMEDEIARLTRNFSGIVNLDRAPGALFIVDPRHEETAVREAKKMGIFLIALANSDCNMKEIDCPVPANDGSRSSIAFFLGKVAEAYKEGVADKEKTAAEKAAEASAAEKPE